MIVGIDASNVRSGGGLAHLAGVLGHAEPGAHGISRIVVWGAAATLEHLPERPWLQRIHEPILDRRLPFRLWWQRYRLPQLAASCDLVWLDSGYAIGRLPPTVAHSHNLLPFDLSEIRRYGLSLTTLRLLLLRWAQTRTFRGAAGVIFLTQGARDAVLATTGPLARMAVIPHGVEDRFRIPARPPRRLSDCTLENPIRLLYVSIVDVYKHQWHVAEAVASLRRAGLPVALDLIGPAYPPALLRLRRVLGRHDPQGTYLRYRGSLPYSEIETAYHMADLFVFASSCETISNILLEAMAAALPIACSNRPPMPEVAGDAAEYFDPEQPDDIARAIRTLIDDVELRARCAKSAMERAARFSWVRCADETLAFLAATVYGANAGIESASGGRGR